MANEIKLKVTLELDERWASNHDEAELIERLKDSWGTVLGYRGEIKRLNIVKR